MVNTAQCALSRRYLAAIRTHLAEDPETGLATADELGREASVMEMGPADLALVHEEALMALMSPEQALGTGNGTIRQAGFFFRRALAPLAEAACATDPARGKVKRPEVCASTAEMSAAKRRLLRETAKRKDAECALKEERRQYGKLLAESKIMHTQLRHLSHEILRAQEEERKKISRELHDEISQILTGINVRLAALKIESAANAQDIGKKIASAQRLVERSVATVHRFARELRPAMLDDLGLIPALTAHMKDVRKRTGLRIHLETLQAGVLETVDSLKQTVLYRIAQEALDNAAKHAQASLVTVSIRAETDHICLEVIDDGKSFCVRGVVGNKRRKQLGLIGMRERAEMVGGTFDIESAPARGTTVRVRIPIRNGFGNGAGNHLET